MLTLQLTVPVNTKIRHKEKMWGDYTPRMTLRWSLGQYCLHWCWRSRSPPCLQCCCCLWYCPTCWRDDAEEARAVASRRSPKTLSPAYPCRHWSGRGSGGSTRPVHLCAQVNRTGEGSCSTRGRTEVRVGKHWRTSVLLFVPIGGVYVHAGVTFGIINRACLIQ